MWDPDEHAGKILNPNIAQPRVSIITANTADTVTALSDLRAIADVSDPYQIDDYRLGSSPLSPCIDAANNNAVTVCSADLDGNERFLNEPTNDPESDPGMNSPEHLDDIVDMGAYEFGSPAVPDCNTNGTPDECDIGSGSSLDCDGLGVPDECCQADMSGDGAVGSLDLAILLASWGACTDCTPLESSCSCRPDLNNDCSVGPIDLATVLGAWGACP